MKRTLKVLLIFDYPNPPPKESWDEVLATEDLKCEHEVTEALRTLGHEVRVLGIHDRIEPLIEEVREHPPEIVFNLAEAFAEDREHEASIAGLLEMLRVPYTGCRPGSLTICRHKAFTKRILTPHRIHVPTSILFLRGQPVKSLRPLKFPVFVKPLGLEGSDGIAQSSFAETPEACLERVRFLHDNLQTDALVEEYIDGRECYSGVLGIERLKVLPLREMVFTKFPEERPKFASFKAKWDEAFRKRWGIENTFAVAMPDGLETKIARLSRTVFRALQLEGCARLDLRITPENVVYLIEVNPNPGLASDDEIAQAAAKAGIPYPQLIQQIVGFGLQRSRIRAGTASQ
jgi:D-alanine-D-alanine ligase